MFAKCISGLKAGLQFSIPSLEILEAKDQENIVSNRLPPNSGQILGHVSHVYIKLLPSQQKPGQMNEDEEEEGELVEAPIRAEGLGTAWRPYWVKVEKTVLIS